MSERMRFADLWDRPSWANRLTDGPALSSRCQHEWLKLETDVCRVDELCLVCGATRGGDIDDATRVWKVGT